MTNFFSVVVDWMLTIVCTISLAVAIPAVVVADVGVALFLLNR